MLPHSPARVQASFCILRPHSLTCTLFLVHIDGSNEIDEHRHYTDRQLSLQSTSFTGNDTLSLASYSGPLLFSYGQPLLSFKRFQSGDAVGEIVPYERQVDEMYA